MRVFLAATFVFAGMLLAVILLSQAGWFERLPVLLLGTGMALYFLVLCVVALVLFNAFPRDPRPGIDFDTIEQMDAKGLLVSTVYHATRAFQVEEMEDEGLHYFLELVDGSVLYLSGQYLYDYEDLKDQDFDDVTDVSGRRRFPCTEFTVRRHREEGWVVHIEWRGAPLELDSVEPAIALAFDETGWIPVDGEVITDRTYDSIRDRMRL